MSQIGYLPRAPFRPRYQGDYDVYAADPPNVYRNGGTTTWINPNPAPPRSSIRFQADPASFDAQDMALRAAYAEATRGAVPAAMAQAPAVPAVNPYEMGGDPSLLGEFGQAGRYQRFLAEQQAARAADALPVVSLPAPVRAPLMSSPEPSPEARARMQQFWQQAAQGESLQPRGRWIMGGAIPAAMKAKFLTDQAANDAAMVMADREADRFRMEQENAARELGLREQEMAMTEAQKMKALEFAREQLRANMGMKMMELAGNDEDLKLARSFMLPPAAAGGPGGAYGGSPLNHSVAALAQAMNQPVPAREAESLYVAPEFQTPATEAERMAALVKMIQEAQQAPPDRTQSPALPGSSLDQMMRGLAY